METFYCIECRYDYPLEKLGRLIAGAHRDGGGVGFCFLCMRTADVGVAAALADGRALPPAITAAPEHEASA